MTAIRALGRVFVALLITATLLAALATLSPTFGYELLGIFSALARFFGASLS